MEVSIEYLRERLVEFQAQKEDAIRQLSAVRGAMQFASFLIQQLEGEGLVTPPLSEEKDDG